ncbi:MAG: tetratricopeptide repeat protein [Chthoniobacterales bacterium]|nr:tetratricopeptide repeat protein [Chthoniobacterales bacterium]
MAPAPPGRNHDLPPADRDEFATTRETCGDAAASRDDHTEALSCWGESLAILQERGRGTAAARVATKMAAVEESLGRADEACAHYAQAADAHLLGGEVHLVPMCLNNLAMLRKLAGESEESAEILRRALGQCTLCHGEHHHETALIASNLGAVLAECGDLLGAAQAHMEALRVREGLYGPTHPEVGLSLGHLAVVHQLAGEEEKARRHYAAALAILGEFPGLHSAERAVLQANLDELNMPADTA